jgi:hypothetical protein
MTSSLLALSMLELFVALVGSLLAGVCAVFYLRRVRIERPAIGAFNGRDIGVLFVFLTILPTFYLVLPQSGLTALLAITFTASLSIGLRPLLSPGRVWLVVGLLLGANIWMGRTMFGTVLGWQLFWLENDVIVLFGVVAVANLYIQGGMRLRLVAWFSLILAVYDVVFTAVVPVSDYLAEHFIGFPLFPAIGMRRGTDNASIGLGDLLIYASFAAAAFKAYGMRAVRVALVLIAVFGAALPSVAPLLINFIDARADVVVPVQTMFGPAAFLGYRWMRRRYGPERTMKEFLASADTVRRPAAAAPRPAPVPEPAGARPIPAQSAPLR